MARTPDTTKNKITQLVQQVIDTCPYEYNSKLYWIYTTGMLRTILIDTAQQDSTVRARLQQIRDCNRVRYNNTLK